MYARAGRLTMRMISAADVYMYTGRDNFIVMYRNVSEYRIARLPNPHDLFWTRGIFLPYF